MERRLNWNVLVNDWKEAEDWQELKVNTKRFITLMLLSVVFIVVIGIGAHLRHQIMSERALQQMKAVEVKQQTLQTMLAEEMSLYQAHQHTEPMSLKHVSFWLFKLLTNASLNDPVALISNELLYSSVNEKSILVHGGSGSDPKIAPQDQHLFHYEPTDGAYIDSLVEHVGDSSAPYLNKANGSYKQGGQPDSLRIDSSQHDNEEETTASEDNSNNDYTKMDKTDKDKPVAFIYHTHNRESWKAELSDDARDVQSSNKNITLVGQRLAEELERLGLGAMVSDTDYPTTVPDYEWEYSYKYSRKTVKEAIASNHELQYIFDLHRDSQERKYTTAEINGESYAQVYFIVGQRNPNWNENEAFARKLHNKLEEQYPGLSRGIWGKNANSGNAEYNQSLSSQSILIEVGGIDNTLEECYRTAKALAEVIAQIHQES